MKIEDIIGTKEDYYKNWSWGIALTIIILSALLIAGVMLFGNYVFHLKEPQIQEGSPRGCIVPSSRLGRGYGIVLLERNYTCSYTSKLIK